MSAAARTELRLVVLGRTGTGQDPVCTILGLQDNGPGKASPEVQECCKYRGEAAGRQVVLVSSPAWFSSSCPPEERRSFISSFLALSSPGPHAFLLCVPVNRQADGEAEALDALVELLGPASVSRHTIVLFTHTEELEEDETLEEYLVTWRKDLVELVGRCGDRYHTLETWGRAAEEGGRAVEHLLGKVEQAVGESGSQSFSCPLYQEAERRVRERQEEIEKQRSSEGRVEEAEGDVEAVREQAEKSVGDLDVDVDSIFPSTSLTPSPAAPSFLRGLWEKLTQWFNWLPKLVRREALLGALVGLFVGGPYGGVVGASVGSVATEVQRRKTQKTK